MSNKGEYKNKIVTGVSPTAGGHFATQPFDGKVVEAFRAMADEAEREINAGRSAGKFLIRKRTEDSMTKGRSKAPYWLEFVPASEVQAYEATRPPRTAGQGF